jgi:hypothetical protein
MSRQTARILPTRQRRGINVHMLAAGSDGVEYGLSLCMNVSLAANSELGHRQHAAAIRSAGDFGGTTRLGRGVVYLLNERRVNHSPRVSLKRGIALRRPPGTPNRKAENGRKRRPEPAWWCVRTHPSLRETRTKSWLGRTPHWFRESQVCRWTEGAWLAQPGQLARCCTQDVCTRVLFSSPGVYAWVTEPKCHVCFSFQSPFRGRERLIPRQFTSTNESTSPKGGFREKNDP